MSEPGDLVPTGKGAACGYTWQAVQAATRRALAACGLGEHAETVIAAQSAALTEDRTYSWPSFESGNLVSLRTGAWSPRTIARRAEAIRAALFATRPDLAEPKYALLVDLACQQDASAELKHESIERDAAKGAPIKERSLEAASAATKVAMDALDRLGYGPRASAELRQIDSVSDVNAALVAQIAPEWPRAVRGALEAIGVADQVEVFEAHFFALLRAPQTQEDND